MNAVEVVDVPPSATEDQARKLLNRPCEENRYMLVQVVILPDGTQRAIYRMLARALDMKPGERALLCRFGGNRDGKEDAARALIEANRSKSLREIVNMLKQAGIKRGKTWVSEARMATQGSGSKVTE